MDLLRVFHQGLLILITYHWLSANQTWPWSLWASVWVNCFELPDSLCCESVVLRFFANILQIRKELSDDVCPKFHKRRIWIMKIGLLEWHILKITCMGCRRCFGSFHQLWWLCSGKLRLNSRCWCMYTVSMEINVMYTCNQVLTEVNCDEESCWISKINCLSWSADEYYWCEQALSKEALPDGTEFISADLRSAFRGSSVTLHG